MQKQKKITRLTFAVDFILLAKKLEFSNEKDRRNQRTSDLIMRVSMIYVGGGRKYEDLINDVGNNAFEEYHEWYKKNIFDVVKNNPEHLRQDQEDLPFPKYDVNKYDIGKYFNGLNKEVFEELQKMVIFLFDPRSKVLLEKERSRSKEKDEDEDFVNHTIYFSVLAQSILIAALEGGKFLDRLEEIVSKYSSEQVNLEKMSSDKFENNNDIASIALNFLNRKNYFN